METIIVFLRDTLSGTLYAIVSIVCSILIFICIWLLIKRNRHVKKAAEEFASSHIVIINSKGEEETVKIETSSLSKVDTNSSSVSTLPAASSLHNAPVSSASLSIASKDSTTVNNKAVVTINPLEVASVSSTMNVIGVTSAQKSAMGFSGSEVKTSLGNETTVTSNSVNTNENIIDPASIASAVGTTKLIDPASIASAVGTTKLVDPASVASAVGTTVLDDSASVTGAVGTTNTAEVVSSADSIATQSTNNQNFTN